MSLGRYRRLTAAELERFAGREWVAWGSGRDPREFRLDGVALHLPEHAAPAMFVWSFAAMNGDDRGTPVFSHVPYPHKLPEATRRALTELQAFSGGFDGFLRHVAARTSRLD